MMRAFPFGWRQWQVMQNTATPTSTNITALNYWVGGSFWAARTETIDRIYFRTSTVSTPSLTLESAITELDANGYPLGTNVAVSSTTTVDPTQNTIYEHTISASVTKGNLYGVILRCTAWSAGSVNIMHRSAWGWGGQFPSASYNLGANSKQNSAAAIMVRYASSGIVHTMGLICPHATGSAASGTSTGNVVANRIVTDRPMLLAGYSSYGETEVAADFGIFAGTDNTPLTGTTVSIWNSIATTAAGSIFVALPTPYLLPAGTYRVGLKQTTTTSISVNNADFYVAGRQAAYPNYDADTYQSIYSGGAWADTTTKFVCIQPVFVGGPDDRPNPSMLIGL